MVTVIGGVTHVSAAIITPVLNTADKTIHIPGASFLGVTNGTNTIVTIAWRFEETKLNQSDEDFVFGPWDSMDYDGAAVSLVPDLLVQTGQPWPTPVSNYNTIQIAWTWQNLPVNILGVLQLGNINFDYSAFSVGLRTYLENNIVNAAPETQFTGGFTVADMGNPTVIPEPSNYAIFLGVSIAVLMASRRLRASQINPQVS